jgi:membrane protease YdiL (CAAX protease family)
LWIPAAFDDSPSLLLLVFLGSFGPSLGAVLLIATNRQRRSGLKELLGRLLAWRISIPWYLLLLLGPLTVALVTTVVDGLFRGSWPGLAHKPNPTPAPASLPDKLVFGGPLGEEVRWRDYALPRL